MLGQKNCRALNLCQPTCKIHCGCGAGMILKICILSIESETRYEIIGFMSFLIENKCIKDLKLVMVKEIVFL